MATFQSGGRSIRIDHYAPKRQGTHAAVILVHGAGGPLPGVDPYAEQAAGFGVHVFVVHYFDRTGHEWVWGSTIREHFLDFLETLRDAVTSVSQHPGVDPGRIGLLGFSLGGFLSLALATEDNRIAAVAEFFGGLPEEFLQNAGKLPPVLILHGADDPTVPVAEAHRLEALLKQHKVPHEIKIYSGQGHKFQGLAQLDAIRRVIGFFKKHLAHARVA